MTIPFSVYDFFGYLASGFMLLCVTDYAFDGNWILRESLPPVQLAVYVVLGYILGHVVANVSSYLLEHRFLRGILVSPEETLFDEKPREGGWASIFPVFYKPFPAETRNRVLEKARRAGIDRAGRGLFFHCLPVVMTHEHVLGRLNTFLNLYGFCRNTSMAAMFSVPLLIAGQIAHFQWPKFWWTVGALCLAVGMFYRYLKFFRHYTEEVFRVYAELPRRDEA